MKYDLLLAVGSSAAASASVIGVFWKYEDVASPEVKQRVALWLKHSGEADSALNWADHVIDAFNRFFWATPFFTTMLPAILLCFSHGGFVYAVTLDDTEISRSPSFFSDFIHDPFDLVMAGPFLRVINCIPDYFSYMKSRKLLNVMSRSERSFRLRQFALLDTILTAGIFAVALCMLVVSIDITTMGPGYRLEMIATDVPQVLSAWHAILTLNPLAREGQLPIGVFFYAALLLRPANYSDSNPGHKSRQNVVIRSFELSLYFAELNS